MCRWPEKLHWLHQPFWIRHACFIFITCKPTILVFIWYARFFVPIFTFPLSWFKSTPPKKKDYGMVHFVMFDTETDLGKGLISPEEFGGRQLLNNGPFGTENQQINFLNVDLSSVNRKVTRMYMCFSFLSFSIR